MKDATYRVEFNHSNGKYFVNTSVSWSVKDWRGKNMTHSGQRSGTIYTRSRFKTWLKKYNLPVDDTIVNMLPRSI